MAPSGPIPIEIGKRNKFDEMKIGNILQMLGWIRARRRVNGLRYYVFYHPDKFDFLPDRQNAPETIPETISGTIWDD